MRVIGAPAGYGSPLHCRVLAKSPDSQRLVVVEARESELGELFRRYAPYVSTIGLRLLGRDDDLDDLVQDVFIEAYRGIHGLRTPEAIRGWLARITVRRATRRLRARKL